MRNRVAFDKTLLLLIFGFLSFGLVMVFSSSAVATGSSGTFFRQVVFMACGLGAMLVIMRVDYRYFGSKPVILGLLALTYILLLGALASPPINHANRWLVIGPFRAQPSELAKLVAILFTSYFFVRHQDGEPNRREAFTYCAILGSILGLVLVQPDFGTAACIAFIAAVLLFLSGLRLRYFAMAFLASIPTFYLLVYRVPYRRDRILAFLDPEADPLGTGYQIRQSLIAIGSGGPGGQGFAQSKQKLAFLPEAHNDFIFSIIGEELGLFGAAVLVGIVLLFFWKGVKISLRSDTPFGSLVGLGIVVMIVTQALLNMSVAMGLLPTKGIPLPFISAGGSSLLVMLVSAGILLNISAHPRSPTDPPWYAEG